ncbi:DUF1801 domain-containing protein [Sulfitobacter sp. HNIBRBA2951]|uniref:DUF1801 domain-containing protein n=1 Tax=Sulfitobacter aquimarinus TaxID=3158557 RepID=UPI0032DE8C07
MTDPFDQTLSAWPPQACAVFNKIRALILETAQTAGVGTLEESLKWHQPAWRPQKPRTGSTLRLNWDAGAPNTIALFVDCKTTIAAEMFAAYPYDFMYESNRGLRLHLGAPLPEQAIAYLAERTFTYHRKS